MAITVSGAAQKQPWTEAFTQNSADAFATAFAENVRLQASALAKPIIGRDSVKVVMAGASAGYENVTFTDQAVSDKRTWLTWQVRTYSGLELSGVTVLTMNENGEIAEITIDHRPLHTMLKFSAELGERVKDQIDRSHFYRAKGSGF
jgi:hypothetical protein